MEAFRVYCQIFSTLVTFEYLVTGLDTFSSRLPDFMENFKESLLTIARHDDIDFIDLSARNPCYEGNIAFRKSNIPVTNTSCNSDSGTFVTCSLSDGEGMVNLTLELFKDCQRVVPQISGGEKSLHLKIWIPVLGLIMLVLITTLLTFGAKRAYKKRESSKSFSIIGKEQKKPNYTTLQTQNSCISSNTNITTTTIPDTPHRTPSSPNLFDCPTDDSAFSSMNTFETTPEDEGSIPGELVTGYDLGSASHSDLNIIYTRSTTSLNEFVILDVDVNNESSTDATLRKVKFAEVEEKEINGKSDDVKI